MLKVPGKNFQVLFLTYFIPFALLICLAAIYTFEGEKDRELSRLKTVQQNNVSKIVNNLNIELDDVFRDIVYLSKQTTLLEYIHTPSTKNLLKLQQDFINFSSSKKIYDQVRLLDSEGFEKVRINYKPTQPFIVPEAKLQNKGNRYYFADAFRLKQGQIFISPLDLNIEQGQIEKPYKPMIRIGMPVFVMNNGQYEKYGIILLNYYGSYLLDIFSDENEKISQLSLINNQSYWLYSDNKDYEWGFMIKQPNFRLSVQFPDAWKIIGPGQSGQFLNKNGLWTYEAVYPVKISANSSSGSGTAFQASKKTYSEQEYFWKIISFVPDEAVKQLYSHAFKKIGLSSLGLLVVGFFASIYISLLLIRHEQNIVNTQKLAEREKFLNNMTEGVIGLDNQGQCAFINKKALSMLDYSLSEVMGRNMHELIHHHYPDGKVYPFEDCQIHQMVTTAETNNQEDWFFKKNGQGFHVRINISLINTDNKIEGSVLSFIDISKEKENEKLLWDKTNYDQLTHLPNRHFFRYLLNEQVVHARYNKQQLWLLIIDIDRFNDINEGLGHQFGDELLVQFSQRLSDLYRGNSIIARIGSDEFALLLTDIQDVGRLERLVLNLLNKIKPTFNINNNSLDVTISIGISNYPNDTEKADELIKFADQSISVSKKQGMNKYTYFTPELQYASLFRIEIANEVQKAIQNNEFQLFYQPIIDINSESVYKAEALIRWIHPEKGMISPAGFIPIAEETDLIIKIGHWVFNAAFEQLKNWQDVLPNDFQISLNMSPNQLNAEDESDDIWINRMQQLSISPSHIVIEITESALVRDNKIINKTLDDFHQMGLNLAIDDFGTGYSSLSYIQKYPFDFLKIDQSFVRDMKPETKEAALCDTMIMMAHKLGMKVIAEGVEAKEQLDLLKTMNCDYVQGYYFSKPLPASDFINYISQFSIDNI